jgi:hypothetical protein
MVIHAFLLIVVDRLRLLFLTLSVSASVISLFLNTQISRDQPFGFFPRLKLGVRSGLILIGVFISALKG